MRIGIDLGGTKIEIIALSDDGIVLDRRRVDTPRGGYDDTVACIVHLVSQLESELGERGSIGIGTPGALSPATGLMKNANSTSLIGRAFDKDLGAALCRPVKLTNDANCFALSEAVDGAGAGYRVVFGVIIGTGTGAGICVDRSVLVGPNAIAGEWGHNALPWPQDDERPGPSCYCGRHGCVERFLSGPAMTADHLRLTGQSLRSKDIVAAARGGDDRAIDSYQRYVNRMARALAAVINILDPDVIVLGGGMSNIDELYEDVPRQWARYVFSDRVDTLLKPPHHGDSSGVRGAAWL